MGDEQSFLNTNAGRVIAAVLVLLGLGAVVFAASRYFGPSAAARTSAERTFICAETKKSFGYTLKAGDMLPVRSPHSGRNTGFPAEACNWSSDGQVSARETFVLLNSHVGSDEPTFCPDCGRLVVGHNPPADASRKAPPTQQEYRASGRRK
jgi:hypothetical protein